MSHEPIDTRATAYVFGELSSQQAAAFERDLAQSSELRDEVAAIRETIGTLKSEFESRTTSVGDSQRDAIERAISQRSSVGTVATDHHSVAMSNRQLAVFAVLAVCVLIVVGLSYPYVQGPADATISMNESTSRPAQRSNESENPVADDQDKQVAVLVDAFNDLIKQGRYAEAEVVARQVTEIQPNGPLSTNMFRTAEMGQRLTEDETVAGQKELAFVDELVDVDRSAIAPSAPIQFPDAAQWEQLSRRRLSSDAGAVKLHDSTGKVAGRGIAQEHQRRFDGASLSSPESPKVANSTSENSVEKYQYFSPPSTNKGTATKGAAELPELSRQEVDNNGDGDPDAIWVDSGLTRAKTARERRPGRRRGGQDMEMDDMMEDMMGMGTEMLEEETEDRFAIGQSAPPAGMMGMGGMAMEMGGMEDMMDTMDFGMMGGALGDQFAPIEDNPFVDVTASPLSTFSIDVDTASYAKVRSLLNRNSLPRPDAVRIEELLNYFNYDYAPPVDDHPFAASMDVAACPWNQKHRLARIGIKGKVIEENRPSSNLVFLLDVSGSMNEPDKLPLVLQGMKMLTGQLSENDKVGIVVYAGAAGLVLDATRGDRKQEIVAALNRLHAGGSTNGAGGIQLAYEVARDNFIVGGTNRVILCTDGDFNVGVTGTDQIVKIAQENAKSKIFLSVLGFGTGNLNDAMMEQVSNKANGNYAFIDSESEARKVLVEELGGTLVTIAKDVKIQVEFNPKEIASYRLIGYENRMLEAQDFNDDKKDAGEIGAGHTVTALYELVPADVNDANVPAVDELRYQKRTRLSKQAGSGETLVLKLRYKQPEGDTSTLIEFPVSDSGKGFSQADRDFQFAASVAAFGMLLRNSAYKGDATFAGVAEIAAGSVSEDRSGYRQEFLKLVAKAKQLRGE